MSRPAQPRQHLLGFFLVLLGIALLRVAVGFISIPPNHAWIVTASVVVTVIFVAAPILGLFWAAGYGWTPLKSVCLLIGGAAVWFVCLFFTHRVTSHLLGGMLVSLGQSGLICWCFAIGSLLALFLKDRNLVLPIAIFLALFDMWLVFAPEGMVQRTVVQGPMTILKQMAYQAPLVQTKSAGGKAEAMLFVGPADFVFLSMFFVALYRFKMRPIPTLFVIMPVLAVYLLVVLCFPNVHLGPISLGALPALLPIGIVVLVVNRDQFQLNRDEKMTTVVLTVVGTVVVIWRIWQPLPPSQVVTLPSLDDPTAQGSLPSPRQGFPGPRRLPHRNAPEDKQYPL